VIACRTAYDMVTVAQGTFYGSDALPITKLTASKHWRIYAVMTKKAHRTRQQQWTSENMHLFGMGPTVHSTSICLVSLYSRTIWLPHSPNFCRTSWTWGPWSHNH